MKACRSEPRAADDRFDTRSDIGLAKATCKSMEKSVTSFGTGKDEAAETR